MADIPRTYQNMPGNIPVGFPAQHQDVQPGSQMQMNPQPITDNPAYLPARKLANRIAIVTGGDSGIGQAVCIAYAKEGADLVVPYFFGNQADAENTRQVVQSFGRRCLLVECDLKQEAAARQVADTAMQNFNRIDILVNNIGVQFPQNSILDITAEQLNNTFATNIISFFHMTKAVLPHLKSGASIINTTSITAYQGSPTLLDYSATKGAIVSFTRSLSQSLAKNGIRVNAIAPGPVWTPLIVSSFSPEKVATFGRDLPLGRAAQPFELAPSYVYLASEDSAFMTGQVLHVNGGVITES
jgi:NAD(P)-dependent dehydrogenase (short-subunit alcohol dehydrogenase family)